MQSYSKFSDLESQNDSLLQDKLHSDTQLEYARNVEELKTITKLASDVNGITELTTSMNALVHYQGDLVDNIEHNITVAHGQVIIGTDHLKKAEKYSRNKCILGLIVAMVLVIIGLCIAIGFKYHN